MTGRGESLYGLDEARLAELEPGPDRHPGAVRGLRRLLRRRARDRRADPEPARGDLARPDDPGRGARRPERHRRRRRATPPSAAGWPASLRSRVEAVGEAVSDRDRPRVAALEWLDPVYVGGHWVPEMIAAAGGVDVLGAARPEVAGRRLGRGRGRAARGRRGDAVRALRRRVRRPGARARRRAALAGRRAVVAVDAASSFSRPGPRLADGVELLGHLLHPEAVEAPPGIDFEVLWDVARRLWAELRPARSNARVGGEQGADDRHRAEHQHAADLDAPGRSAGGGFRPS